MPENQNDPAGSTQQFRAFVSRDQGGQAPPGRSSGSRTGLIIGVAAVVVVVAVAAIAFAVL